MNRLMVVWRSLGGNFHVSVIKIRKVLKFDNDNNIYWNFLCDGKYIETFHFSVPFNFNFNDFKNIDFRLF